MRETSAGSGPALGAPVMDTLSPTGNKQQNVAAYLPN